MGRIASAPLPCNAHSWHPEAVGQSLKWGVLVTIPLVASFSFTSGCAYRKTGETSAGISRWDYRESCGACHKVPKAKGRTDEEWQTFMMEHRFLAGQDEETAQLFVDYLKMRN